MPRLKSFLTAGLVAATACDQNCGEPDPVTGRISIDTPTENELFAVYQPITFTGSAHDTSGNVLSIAWYLTGGGARTGLGTGSPMVRDSFPVGVPQVEATAINPLTHEEYSATRRFRVRVLNELVFDFNEAEIRRTNGVYDSLVAPGKNPAWSPIDDRIAFVRHDGNDDELFLSNRDGTGEVQLTNNGFNDDAPAWSPDGTRLAFVSEASAGNPEIYIANRDGSNLRRLTTHPGIDITPTWSPSGTQIAFTSDRSGSPQIYTMGVDGFGLQKVTSESYCDRPTWSPAPYNEIAYAARSGPGFDIKVMELANRQIRQLTFGEGTNESPSYAPNGRHVAFMSTRSGKSQIFTIARDGKNLKQITKTGNNQQPDWSK